MPLNSEPLSAINASRDQETCPCRPVRGKGAFAKCDLAMHVCCDVAMHVNVLTSILYPNLNRMPDSGFQTLTRNLNPNLDPTP